MSIRERKKEETTSKGNKEEVLREQRKRIESDNPKGRGGRERIERAGLPVANPSPGT